MCQQTLTMTVIYIILICTADRTSHYVVPDDDDEDTELIPSKLRT